MGTSFLAVAVFILNNLTILLNFAWALNTPCLNPQLQNFILHYRLTQLL